MYNLVVNDNLKWADLVINAAYESRAVDDTQDNPLPPQPVRVQRIQLERVLFRRARSGSSLRLAVDNPCNSFVPLTAKALDSNLARSVIAARPRTLSLTFSQKL